MRDLETNRRRFDYGQFVADLGRIFGRAWAQIAGGVILLGVVPTVAAAMPWWTPAVDLRPTFTIARAAIDLTAHAAVAAFVTAAALQALSGAGSPGVFAPARLLTGFVTSVCLRLFLNWASLAGPLAVAFAPEEDVRLMAMVSVPPSLVVSVAAAGLATPVSIAQRAWVVSAVAESFRLLHGLRWRIVALCLAYLALLWVAEFAAVLMLSAGQVDYLDPGPGRAVVAMAPLVSGALLDVAFAAFFVQARRIADMRSAAEPHDALA